MSDPGIGKGESLQVGTRGVVLVIGVILVLLTAIAFGFTLLFNNRIGVHYTVRHELPAPGVVANERAQRLALEARQRRTLQGAGGRMPIDQAMQAIVARGPRAFEPVK